MELNKYDLAEWVAKIISDCELLGGCYICMFKCEDDDERNCKCYDKERMKEELIKKYNL